MMDQRLRIETNLTTILELWDGLKDEAANRYADKDFPGGPALVMLGPAARLRAWEDKVEAAERLYFEALAPWLEIDDWDFDPQPPLLVLGNIEDKIRVARNQPTKFRATVPHAAKYIRDSLDWMESLNENGYPNYAAMDEVARELSTLRSQMEAVLKEGVRQDTSSAPCFKDDPDTKSGKCGGTLARRTLQRRDCEHVELAKQFIDTRVDKEGKTHQQYETSAVLTVILGYFPHIHEEHKHCDQGGRDDVYRCRKCEKFYTEAEYLLCLRENHESAGRIGHEEKAAG